MDVFTEESFAYINDIKILKYDVINCYEYWLSSSSQKLKEWKVVFITSRKGLLNETTNMFFLICVFSHTVIKIRQSTKMLVLNDSKSCINNDFRIPIPVWMFLRKVVLFSLYSVMFKSLSKTFALRVTRIGKCAHKIQHPLQLVSNCNAWMILSTVNVLIFAGTYFREFVFQNKFAGTYFRDFLLREGVYFSPVINRP